jgi:hypothetical protein
MMVFVWIGFDPSLNFVKSQKTHRLTGCFEIGEGRHENSHIRH